MKINRWFNRSRGQRAERLAESYLRAQGLKTIDNNYSSRQGEIDLIMEDDNNTLIFVEVRYRRSSKFGSASETVDWRKQQRIVKTAAAYIQSRPEYQQYNCRFDVISLEGELEEARLDWIKQAFTA